MLVQRIGESAITRKEKIMTYQRKQRIGILIILATVVMACSIGSGLPQPGNISIKKIIEETQIDNPATIFPITGEMVLIPAGTFQMGCDPEHNGGKECDFEELPLHMVYLDTYSIGKYEVTNEQFSQCVKAGFCKTPRGGAVMPAKYPANSKTWIQADAFCTWIGMRLPTEAEWEKAARGNSDTRAFPWGDQSPDCTLANYTETCVGETVEVGRYPAGASPYGVMDMAGNVEEWVNDWVNILLPGMQLTHPDFQNYYSYSPASNPRGVSSSQTQDKGLRGGNYLYGQVRVAARWRENYMISYDQIGFRCAESSGS
jgi:formylglycine-generating enzyme required for sulfatase activity